MIFHCDHCGTTTDTGSCLERDYRAALDFMDRITWYQWGDDVRKTDVVCGNCTKDYEGIGQWRRIRGGAHLGKTKEQQAHDSEQLASHAHLVGQDPDVQIVSRCEQCEALDEETSDDPLYECNSCGQIFNRSGSADGGSHRCPSCGKFGHKIGDVSCIHCDEGPLAPEPAVFCEVCDEWIAEGDWTAHISGGA